MASRASAARPGFTVTVAKAGAGEYTITDLAELFIVSGTTVYRTLQRDTATAEQDRR
jgi:hypothetical protein